jgi:hypothetical protein
MLDRTVESYVVIYLGEREGEISSLMQSVLGDLSISGLVFLSSPPPRRPPLSADE